MSNPVSRAWRRFVESKWAHGLANRVGVPSGRREQLRLDMQRAWLAVQLWRLNQRSSPPSLNTYQQLLLYSRVVSNEETMPFVADHLRQQILGMASALHQALAEAGDAQPAAQSMLQAHTVMTGQHAPPDTGNAKVVLSQSQVSELARECWGHSLQVKPSTIDHPDAGLGLFVQGQVPVGAVVAIIPGVVYARTQLSRMPNFPKVGKDNHYLTSTIEMNVIDSKPWGLGVLQHQLNDPLPGSPDCSNALGKKEENSNENISSFTNSDISSSNAEFEDSLGINHPSGSGNSSNTLQQQVSHPQAPLSSTPAAHSSRAGFPYPAEGVLTSKPPFLGYACAYSLQPDGTLATADGCGSWSLLALEERHPWSWAHMANHPGPGMQPNVLEVPFDLDLGPHAVHVTSLNPQPTGTPMGASTPGSSSQQTGSAHATSSGACPPWMRAYVPVVPFLEPPPHKNLMSKGWRQAASEALLEVCGWPRTNQHQKHDRSANGEEEEEQVEFRIPFLTSTAGDLPDKKGARVQGLVLMATRALHDGEEVLLNYRLSPHTTRPPWYCSLDPEAEARRWAQMPLKSLLS